MPKTALITGAAKRIGASIAQKLHASGYHVILHYRQSKDEAIKLRDNLNSIRGGSAEVVQADFLESDAISLLVDNVSCRGGDLNVLVNNASSFYPTPLAEITEQQWDELIGSNLRAPFFLSLALYPLLSRCKGSIVNICDIHALHPLKGFPVYSIAKSGVVAMTRSLAQEFAPLVRVNGIAPGAILWPENKMDLNAKQEILSRVPLERCGSPNDIANGVLFFAHNADYVTGQILPIDGGRSLSN